MKKNPKTLLLSSNDQMSIMQKNIGNAIEIIENAFMKKTKGEILLPDKISLVFNEKLQNRINCMPGALLEDAVYGVKWVAVFPENPKEGYKNVTGTMILSELKYGHTLSVMDASYLTAIRTAAIGATAAKFLSCKEVTTIGFIGAGQQARRHLDLIKVVRPGIKKCYVSSFPDGSVESFIEEEKKVHPDIEFINCNDMYEDAVRNSDIIVTAISGQEPILKADWIKQGAFYIHVAGWEDEYDVALKASKIICDDWECIKHRTQTISRMYQQGLLKDDDIYANLDEIVSGEKKGRENDNEFIYFCSVGLAYIDVSFAKYVYEEAKKMNLGIEFEF